MLLQRVAFAWDEGRDFFAVGKTYARNLPQSRVWLLRRHRTHLQTDAPLLRTAVQDGRLAELPLFLAVFLYELVDRGHLRFFQQMFLATHFMTSPNHRRGRWPVVNLSIYRSQQGCQESLELGVESPEATP